MKIAGLRLDVGEKRLQQPKYFRRIKVFTFYVQFSPIGLNVFERLFYQVFQRKSVV